MKRRMRYETWFWEEAPFFRVLIPLIAAIICYDAGSPWLMGDAALYIFCFLLLAAFSMISFRRDMHPALPWVRFGLLQLLVFFSGMLVCRMDDVTVRPHWFGHHIDNEAAYLVRLDRMPAEKAATWKLSINIEGVLRGEQIQPASGKAVVYLYKRDTLPAFRTGDQLLVPGNWQRIGNQNSPFEFDYRKFASRNGIYYQQFLGAGELSVVRRGSMADEGLVSFTHNWCMRQLARYVTDPGTLGILQAMLVGDDVNLDPELRLAYSETGIIHVVAISGSHVMMFFMIISALLFWLKHKRSQWIRYMIALPLVWFYVLVSGAPPSAVRAAIMFSVLAFGISLRKGNHSLNQLFATAFILLCLKPMWLFSVGFQLSFIAVLSLILFFRPLCRLLAPTGRAGRAIWEAVCASLAAEILVAPLVVYYFNLFPVTFLPANIIAWMLMGFVLVLGLLLIAVSWLPVLASLLSVTLTFLVSRFNLIIYRLQDINPVSFRHLVLPGPGLAVVWLAIACFAAFLLRRYKPALFGGLGALSVLLLLVCTGEWRALRQDRIAILNIRGKTHVERICGKRFQVLVKGDTSAGSYTLQAMRTGWSAWKQAPDPERRDVYCVNGKKLLYLYEPVPFDGKISFPVHTLLVDFPVHRLSFSGMRSCIKPEILIIGGYQKEWHLKEWRDSCRLYGIAMHVLKTDGTFVME